MSTPKRRAAESLWRAARTFAEACELGARFVEGELPFFPGWLAPELDPESDPLVPCLAALNRAGMLTLASQPGRALGPDGDGPPRAQRAFVTGFAGADLARRIEACALGVPLFVAAFEARERGGVRLPVGVLAGEPYLWTGYGAGPDELRILRPCVGAEALRELAQARYVCVADLAWEARDLLWDVLSGVVAPARGSPNARRPPA